MYNYFSNYILRPLLNLNCCKDSNGKSITWDAHEMSMRPQKKTSDFRLVQENVLSRAGATSSLPRHAGKGGHLQHLLHEQMSARPQTAICGLARPFEPGALHKKFTHGTHGPSLGEPVPQPRCVEGEDIPLSELEAGDEPPDEQFISGRVNYRQRQVQSDAKTDFQAGRHHDGIMQAAANRVALSDLNAGTGKLNSGLFLDTVMEESRREEPDLSVHSSNKDAIKENTGDKSMGSNPAAGNPVAGNSVAGNSVGDNTVPISVSWNSNDTNGVETTRQWQEWMMLQHHHVEDKRKRVQTNVAALKGSIRQLDEFGRSGGYTRPQPEVRSVRKAIRFWCQKMEMATGKKPPELSKWTWKNLDKLSKADADAFKKYLTEVADLGGKRCLPIYCLNHAIQIGEAMRDDMYRELSRSWMGSKHAIDLYDHLRFCIKRLQDWLDLHNEEFAKRFPPYMKSMVFSGEIPPPNLETYSKFKSPAAYVKAVGGSIAPSVKFHNYGREKNSDIMRRELPDLYINRKS